MDIKSYIDDLFGYIETFENRFSEFKVEAFLQTYNGIYAVFDALRHDREKAVELDRYILEKIQKTPLNSSDLRQLVLQVLVTFFESEADIDGQTNRAYMYCRDLRPSKRDIAYFEDYLIPLLFRDGSLNGSFELNRFFLKQAGQYLDKFGRKIDSDISPEKFDSLSEPRKFLELSRRRQVLGENLLADRSSLEFHLHRVDAFAKISKNSALAEQYLSHWSYLIHSSFWSRLKSSLSEIWGKFKGAFSNARYFRLVLTQRSAAYGFYTIIIIFFLFIAWYGPVLLNNYTQNKLDLYKTNAAQNTRGGTK